MRTQSNYPNIKLTPPTTHLAITLAEGQTENRKVRGAKKYWCNGIKFDSHLEAYAYQLFTINGINVELKKTYILVPKFKYLDEKIRAIEAEPDFRLPDYGFIVDTKGHQTHESKLKFKLLKNHLRETGSTDKVVLLPTPASVRGFVYDLLCQTPS